MSGCASTLDGRYSEIAYKSEEGCHFIQYRRSWMEENISKIKWSGACVDGLMSGKGSLVLYSKQNPAEIKETYFGMMSKGTFDGFGKHTNGKIVKFGTFVDAVHHSSNKGKFYGRRFVDYELKQDGEFNDLGNLEIGKHFFGSHGYIDGEYIKDRKSTGILNGNGVALGVRYPQANFKIQCADISNPKLTAIEKQELDDKCKYGQELIENAPIGWYFQGKPYDTIAAYSKAQSEYVAAKAERERIEAAEAAERARVQAIADAERARVQAIADAERYRLQQIENAKQARYNQLRQPCTDARNEASSLTDPRLEELKAEAIGLSSAALVVALSRKNKYDTNNLQRELNANVENTRRQEAIFAQNKERARARAETICQRTEQAVLNQKNQDDGIPVLSQSTVSYTTPPAQQTQSTSNSSSDNNEALSAQCTAETNRLLKEGTQAVSRGNAQQDANMIRRGMLELARNLQTIISTNEGRCREGKSSVSDRFNALKMLQDVSLACNRGGYGADCDREKQEAVQSVARSQPAPTRSQPTQSTYSNSQGSRSNSGQNSGNSDNSIETAGQCISISRPANSWAVMRNTCSYDIEASWCYVNGDCKYGNWGATNLGTIRAGSSRDASTLTSKSSRLDIYYIACKGRNTSPKETDARYYICNK